MQIRAAAPIVRLLTLAAGAAMLLGGCGRIAETQATETLLASPQLSDLVVLNGVVPLEDAHLPLGGISKVVQQPGTGDLFVSDLEWSNAVYRFDRHGRFLRAINSRDFDVTRGRPLIDFDVDGPDVLILTQFVLLRVRASDGALVATAHPPQVPVNVVASGRTSCVFTTLHGVVCFDAGLSPVASLPVRERDKLAVHVYTPPFPLASASDNVVALAECYAPKLLLYDVTARRTTAVRFPGSSWNAEEFERLWPARAGVSHAAFQRKIQPLLRRMRKVFRLPGRRLLLIDSGSVPRTEDVLVFNPTTLQAVRFDAKIGRVPLPSGSTFSIFGSLVGTSATGLIGQISENDVPDALRSRWSEIQACKGAWQCLFFLDFTVK